MEKKYMANDFAWLNNDQTETEKLAVCFSKNQISNRSDNIDNSNYLLNIYSHEKKIQSKFCRTEIKVLESEHNNDDTVFGGLASGRIAVWDLKSHQKSPDRLSLVSQTSSYLPIVDLKKRDNIIYTIGQEGRIAKWDYRKLEKPILIADITSKLSGAMTELEVIPMGFELCVD